MNNKDQVVITRETETNFYAVFGRRELLMMLKTLDEGREFKDMAMSDTIILNGLLRLDKEGRVQLGNYKTRLP